MTSYKTNVSECRYMSEFESDDQSDRQTLLEIEEGVNKTSNSENFTSPKYKQLTITNYCSVESSLKQKECETPNASSHDKKHNFQKKGVCNKKKGRNRKSSKTNLTKISCWLSKDTKKPIEDKQTENIQNDEVNKEQPSEKDHKKTFKRHSSGSFAKYGLCIPSFQDIIDSQKKYDDHQGYVDKLDEVNCSQESLKLDIEEPCPSTVTLNCKHLTNEEIKKAFIRNKKHIYNIFHGITYSRRHERFQKENPEDQFTTKDLRYNTSMLVFKYEQKEELLSLLYKLFDDDSELGLNNQYFFKVLLPELCLKIFMDVHNMNFKEANEYLENMPLENRNICN